MMASAFPLQVMPARAHDYCHHNSKEIRQVAVRGFDAVVLQRSKVASFPTMTSHSKMLVCEYVPSLHILAAVLATRTIEFPWFYAS
jgi:hypothetical protein